MEEIVFEFLKKKRNGLTKTSKYGINILTGEFLEIPFIKGAKL